MGRIKTIVILLIISLIAPINYSFCAEQLEYTGYYMKRRGQADRRSVSSQNIVKSKKYPATHTRSGTPLKGHTLERYPSCIMYFGVGAEIKDDRWQILVKENENVVRKTVAGVRIKDNNINNLNFLHNLISGNYVKICQPQFNSMPAGKVYGLIYVEPEIDSVQEILLDKKLAVLFDASEEK